MASCRRRRRGCCCRGWGWSSLDRSSLAFPLLHARIECVAGGVADQIDAEDGDREQQARPENQRWLELKILAALGHDVAPGRRLRRDAGAEEGEDGLGEDSRR